MLYSWPLLVIYLDLVCMLIIGVCVWIGFYEHGEKEWKDLGQDVTVSCGGE